MKRIQDDFAKATPYKAKDKKEKQLVCVIASLKSEQDVANLLRDLLTVSEIHEFANRIEMVRLLKQGISYQKIAEKTGSSTTTVTRVAHWLFHGCGGYQKIVDILN